MKLSFSPEDEQFRQEIASWLQLNLTGEFEKLRFRGGPGDEHTFPEERKVWEQKLAEGGWTCVGWSAYLGRRCTSTQTQTLLTRQMNNQIHMLMVLSGWTNLGLKWNSRPK